MTIQGIHHITAISSDAQKTYDFYTKVLGLRLVKKSVNQDDVATYHLFFGNKTGSPGMDLTFFPFANAYPGQRGNGLVTTISFAIPKGTLQFWEERFHSLKVDHEPEREEFGNKRIIFYDNDLQRLELVETDKIDSEFNENVWDVKDIGKVNAIRCFHSATLTVLNLQSIQDVLEVFGYKQVKEDRQSYLFELTGKKSASELIVEEKPSLEQGINGFGTVHHIAFIVKDAEEQLEMRDAIIEIGEGPTHVIDRYYFKSVYFRTKSGILFEIATEGPGFTADESEKELGEKLALPPFLEPHRTLIEQNLIPIKMHE